MLTLEEAYDLDFVVSKYTTVNPYFDALRAGIQSLLGIMSGIAADGRVTAEEANRLGVWLEEWGHLRSLFPFDECESIVTAFMGNERSQDHRDTLKALAAEMPIAGGEPFDARSLVISGVCSVDPLIAFTDRHFVFTGESSRGSRTALEGHVSARGGLLQDNVTKRTDYLVVCDCSSAFWAFSCFGRKVEKAYALRKKGVPVQIVHEVDFWDATQ